MSGKLTSYGLKAAQIAEKSGFLAGGRGGGAGGSGGGPQGLCGERGTCCPRNAGAQSTAVIAVVGDGFGEMEGGLISRGGRNLRVPLHF